VSRPRYRVKAWYSWSDVSAGRYAIDQGYETRAEALAAARASDCPLVDVLDAQERRTIADRETIQHPLGRKGVEWAPRDTLDDPR
jgi:hypothetical protein